MYIHSILIRPLITEKTLNDAKVGKFTFQVKKDTSKQTVKSAVEEAFKVKVESVSTSIVKGRTKRVGTRRTEITESSFKKAIVRLGEGQKIDLFEVGGS